MTTPTLTAQLRLDLRHRLRPMSGRNPDEPHRAVTPLELLYDLTYVIAFAAAADELAHALFVGEVGPGIGAYLFAIFGVSWAWLNFTWFSSAYDNDDALVRAAVVAQMVGVVIFVFGLPVSFEDAAHGASPNNMLLVAGYIVMRVPLIALWLRAAREDPAHRRTSVAYAVVIAVAQVGWLLTTVPGIPAGATVAAIVVLATAELIAPLVIERRYGRAPWNAGHIAERFGLLTLITIGEVIAGTVAAVGALVAEQGWSVAAVAIVAAGLVIAAGLWWAYYLIPSRTILERWPERTWGWRYVHLPLFGAIAAVGAGLHVAALGVEHQELSLLQITLALAVPVACVVVLVFLIWSVLMHSMDFTHVPLFICNLVPLVAAVIIAAVVDAGAPIDLEPGGDLTALVTVIGLVSLSCVIEVVGHELVGYSHTLQAAKRHLLEPEIDERHAATDAAEAST
ncbi:low temperature requirement protein A [Agromyces sp. NPDC058126]|uniref:low temperature requirement protein A n=1 Tax=Agromyces sp. NPDC058126 TaxID=3346350 RepID=UPI0036DD66A0